MGLGRSAYAATRIGRDQGIKMAKFRKSMSRVAVRRGPRVSYGRRTVEPETSECTGALCLSPQEQQYIDSRIHDVERAAERSRLVFIVASAISLLLISVAYNEFWSWSRNIADAVTKKTMYFDEGIWTDQLIMLQLKEWMTGLQFDLPYLGGRFGASDAAIVGGALLIFTGLWCYYATRRENHLVYFIVKDVGEFSFSDKAKFYLSSQLFATQLFMEGKHSRPYRSENFTDDAFNKASKAKNIGRFRRIAPSFIFFLPVVALLFVIGIDVASLFYPSPLRNSSDSLYTYFCGANHVLECERFAPVLQRLAWSFLFLFVVLRLMLLSFNFQRGTLNIINFTREWKAPMVDHSRNRILRTTSQALPPFSSFRRWVNRWILGD